MLERYSHIRMEAKRDAVEALTTVRAGHHSDTIPTIPHNTQVAGH
jgi:hypothetical protein